MTPKERLFSRLAGKPVDRAPNLNITMQRAAEHTGDKYGAFCSDYRVMARSQFETAEYFGIDVLSTMSDAFRETKDYGAPVHFVEDNLPICTAHIIKTPADCLALHGWDPMTSERMLDRIKACSLLAEMGAGRYPVLGWVEGPLAEFADLAGVSEALMMLYDCPDESTAALDVITDQAVACARAQLHSGADVIGMGDAAASLVSPGFYREFIQPREKRIVEAVHSAGGFVKLHICGNITHLLPDVIATGADIVDIDYMVNMADAVTEAAGRCSICGNFDPVSVMLQGTPEDVRAAVCRCLAAGDERSIIAAGCEIPKDTPSENLLAAAEELAACGQ